jgi:micrococcal nuclease
VSDHRGYRAIRVVVLALSASLLAACGGTTAQATATTTIEAVDQGLAPKGRTVAGLPVIRVVDGDTLHVSMRGQEVTVRLIGINSPESVKPDSPIECYGPESSDYAKAALTGQTVTLEFDSSQGRTDQYGRTLAYVWLELPGGGRSLFNLLAVRSGNARERQYGRVPYAWKSAFRSAQQHAQGADAGLWGACSR